MTSQMKLSACSNKLRSSLKTRATLFLEEFRLLKLKDRTILKVKGAHCQIRMNTKRMEDKALVKLNDQAKDLRWAIRTTLISKRAQSLEYDLERSLMEQISPNQ